MSKWNAHLFSPYQNREWWLLTKMELQSAAMLTMFYCNACGADVHRHAWVDNQLRCLKT
jgi:hypothetical protein